MLTCEYDERSGKFRIYHENEWFCTCETFEEAQETMANIAFEDSQEGVFCPDYDTLYPYEDEDLDERGY